MKKISAVIFDMDGVLFDTERMCLDAWKMLAEREGIKNIEEICTRCIGTNSQETERIIRDAYGERLDYDALRHELNYIVNKLLKDNGMPIKSGAYEILEALSQRNIRLAVASSTKHSIVCDELKSAKMYGYFEQIIGGDMLRQSKPAPDIYLKACEALNVSPKKVAAIEDSYNGIRSAHSAALTTIMVPDIVKPNEEILSLTDFCCESLNEAKNVILSIV